MDGLECLREMKLIDPGVKVIVCTGYTGNKKKEAIVKEGVFAFLEKPFKFSDVASYLQKVLHATSAPAAVLKGVSVPAQEEE